MTILIKNQQRHRRLSKTRIKKAARKILSLLEKPTVELSILLVGDRKMQQLNASFRGIHETTDVLSFPQTEFGVRSLEPGNRGKILDSGTTAADSVIGDIVISIPKASVRARMSEVDFYDEVNRLLVHGIMHLFGYDHESSRYRAAIMKKKEQEILDAIKKMD